MTFLVSVVRSFAMRFPVVVGMEIAWPSVGYAASNARSTNSVTIARPSMKMPTTSGSMPEPHFAMQNGRQSIFAINPYSRVTVNRKVTQPIQLAQEIALVQRVT